MILIDNLSYRIGKAPAILHNINLEIKSGESVAVLGANGSGKSSLAKLIAGLSLPSTGKITVDLLETTSDEFQSSLGKTVGIVFQNPEHQIISINVERELALGLENYGVAQNKIAADVAEFLKSFELEALKDKRPDQLSGGQKQILALASMMILKPRVLILDEPTAHLDSRGKEIFAEFLDKVNSKDNMIVYITQNIEEVREFDRVIIMERGTIAEDITPAKLLRSKSLFAKYHLAYPSKQKQQKKSDDNQMAIAFSENEKPILKCSKLNFGWRNSETRIIENLNLELYPGKVLGVMGPTGCGKTTLALILAGLLKPIDGEILFQDKKATQSELIKSVAYLFQSPERGMFADTLFEDISYGPRNFGKNIETTEKLVERSFGQVGLDYEKFKDRSPFRLSGGEARLAAIAGVLACDKEIIILDEPTEELDYSGRMRIIKIINNLQESGKAIMLISHDEDFIHVAVDRIVEL